MSPELDFRVCAEVCRVAGGRRRRRAELTGVSETMVSEVSEMEAGAESEMSETELGVPLHPPPLQGGDVPTPW